jgi:tripartite-type tricarboxylate transporter receptor subunit TctC
MNRRPISRLAAAVGICALATVGCANPNGLGASGGGSSATEVPSRIELVIPLSPGGGTDTWARFITPKLSQFLPSRPTFTPINDEGGEGIPATNAFVRADVTDGSEILVATTSSLYQFMLGQQGVEFDFTQMRPLTVSGAGAAFYVSKDSGIANADDLVARGGTLKYGGMSATGSDLANLLAFNLLDLKVDVTFGFEGRGPALLAFQRGELNSDLSSTSTFQREVKPMINAGEVVPLWSMGVVQDGQLVRDPALPDLPTPAEVYEQMHGKAPSGPALDAYVAAVAAGFTYQKGLWVNGGTSDEIVMAFGQATKDLSAAPGFADESKAVLGDYPLYPGSEYEDEIKAALTLTPDVREYIAGVLADKYDARVN